jgi:hypothetical protein
MGKIRKQKGQMKVYRHFAVWTVAATLLLAMFADGENKQAIREDIKEERMEDANKGEVAELTEKPLVFQRMPETGGFDESANTFGAPMDGSAGSGTIAASGGGEDPRLAEPWAAYGMTRTQWEALDEAQRERLIARLRQSVTDKPMDRSATEAIIRASAARSGSEYDPEGGDAPR